MTINLNGPGVSIAEVVAVARQSAPVALTSAATERMVAARQVVETLAEGEPTYGVSTGFGSLATVTIPPERRAALQEALVRSHAAGMGPSVETEVVRAMVFLRARTLAMGQWSPAHSGREFVGSHQPWHSPSGARTRVTRGFGRSRSPRPWGFGFVGRGRSRG